MNVQASVYVWLKIWVPSTKCQYIYKRKNKDKHLKYTTLAQWYQGYVLNSLYELYNKRCYCAGRLTALRLMCSELVI